MVLWFGIVALIPAVRAVCAEVPKWLKGLPC